MQKYEYYNYNYYGDENIGYKFPKSAYRDLLKACFEHSSFFSVRIMGIKAADKIPQELDKFRIATSERVLELYGIRTIYDGDSYATQEIRCYKLSAEVCDFILNFTDDLFEWNYVCGDENPEDPMFFRNDESVFFYSSIHDEYCYLLVKPNENVDSIIQRRNAEDGTISWVKNTGDGSMC